MKKILFIGMYPNPVDKYKNVFFQNLIYAVADQGIECVVISPVSITKYRSSIKKIPRQKTEETSNGTKLEVYYPRFLSASSFGFGPLNTEHISEYLFEKAAIRTVKKLNKNFDAVYGHFFLYGGLAAVSIGRLIRIPSFIAYGECDFYSQVLKTYGLPKRKKIEGLSGIISVSNKNTKELTELGIIPNDISILTYPNCVDSSLFFKMSKDECRTKLKLPKRIFLVGFVGGFIERKGDKRLLEAAKNIDDVFLAFAGKGEKAPTGENVVFCKPLAHEDIPIFLNSLDCFCLPTLSEGSSNAIAEALSCGCAIVSSDLPFNEELLSKENSILVDPNSIEEIRIALIRLRDDTNLRERLQTGALETAKNLSITNRARAVIEFIESKVKRHEN